MRASALNPSSNFFCCKTASPSALNCSLATSCFSMLAETPFLLDKAACANAVAPPAAPPVALIVSNVFAKAISVCSICISAACVATPKLAYVLLNCPSKLFTTSLLSCSKFFKVLSKASLLPLASALSFFALAIPTIVLAIVAPACTASIAISAILFYFFKI